MADGSHFQNLPGGAAESPGGENRERQRGTAADLGARQPTGGERAAVMDDVRGNNYMCRSRE